MSCYGKKMQVAPEKLLKTKGKRIKSEGKIALFPGLPSVSWACDPPLGMGIYEKSEGISYDVDENKGRKAAVLGISYDVTDSKCT